MGQHPGTPFPTDFSSNGQLQVLGGNLVSFRPPGGNCRKSGGTHGNPQFSKGSGFSPVAQTWLQTVTAPLDSSSSPCAESLVVTFEASFLC